MQSKSEKAILAGHQSRLTANVAVTSASRGVSLVLVLITGVIIARALGPEGKGTYTLVTYLALLLPAFGGFGLSTAGIYLVSRKLYSLKAVASTNFAWLIGVSSVWIAAMLVIGRVAGATVFPGLTSAQFIAGIGAGCILFFMLFTKDLLLSEQRVSAFNLTYLSEFCSRLALVLILLVGVGTGLAGAIWAWIGSLLIASMLAVLLLSKNVTFMPRLKASLLRKQLHFGLRTYCGYVLQIINRRFDVFWVNMFLGASFLGYYSVSFTMAEVLWLVPEAVGLVLFPVVASLTDRAGVTTAAFSCRHTLFITGLLSLVAVATAKPLLLLVYGDAFLPSLAAFYILVPSALAYAVWKTLTAGLRGIGKPQIDIYSGLVAVAPTIALNFLLIPKVGILGAAIASITAYTASALIVAVYFHRVSRLGLREIFLINRNDLRLYSDWLRKGWVWATR